MNDKGPDGRFIKGMIPWNKGKTCPEETRRKISKALKGNIPWIKGRKMPEEQRQKLLGNKHCLGRVLSEETKRKMSLSAMGSQNALGRIVSEETRRKLSIASKGRPGIIHSPETRAKLSAALKGRFTGPDHPMFGRTHTPEAKKKIGEGSKKYWADPEHKDMRVKRMHSASFRRPTSAEVGLREILDDTCLGEYKYTGDGSFVIGGATPDFTNCNGQKKVIEMFGTYWHSERVTGKSEEQEEHDKREKYSGFGYKCLIVWEHELHDKVAVATRISDFNGRE